MVYKTTPTSSTNINLKSFLLITPALILLLYISCIDKLLILYISDINQIYIEYISSINPIYIKYIKNI